MKKCSKCGIEKENSEFGTLKMSIDGFRGDCKQCRKEYSVKNKERKAEYDREYRETNKDRLLAQKRKYGKENKEKIKLYKEKNKEKIAEQKRKHRAENIEKIKEYRKKQHADNRESEIEQCRKYREENPEKVKEYRETNRELKNKQGREYSRKLRRDNPEKVKDIYRRFMQTPKGKICIQKRSSKRRLLGHEPLNSWFKGSDAHHLRYSNTPEDKDNDITIYAPRELHTSIWHNGNTGQGIRDINIKILEWYLSETTAESRNKKAVDLYLKYCMLPDPIWIK
jgi:hypothetical protein